MPTIGSVENAPKGTSLYTGTTGKSAAEAGNDLGKDDFMKLLLAQLTNQDPLKPMDDQAFIAQVATFNQLEQLTNMRKTLEAVLDSQQLAEASSMIGKSVTAEDAEAKAVSGVVTAASVEDGVAMLHLGATKVKLDSVTAVASDEDGLPGAGR